MGEKRRQEETGFRARGKSLAHIQNGKCRQGVWAQGLELKGPLQVPLVWQSQVLSTEKEARSRGEPRERLWVCHLSQALDHDLRRLSRDQNPGEPLRDPQGLLSLSHLSCNVSLFPHCQVSNCLLSSLLHSVVSQAQWVHFYHPVVWVSLPTICYH